MKTRPVPDPAEIAEALLTQDFYLTISRQAAAVRPLAPRLEDDPRFAPRPKMSAADHNAFPNGRHQ